MRYVGQCIFHQDSCNKDKQTCLSSNLVNKICVGCRMHGLVRLMHQFRTSTSDLQHDILVIEEHPTISLAVNLVHCIKAHFINRCIMLVKQRPKSHTDACMTTVLCDKARQQEVGVTLCRRSMSEVEMQFKMTMPEHTVAYLVLQHLQPLMQLAWLHLQHPQCPWQLLVQQQPYSPPSWLCPHSLG